MASLILFFLAMLVTHSAFAQTTSHKKATKRAKKSSIAVQPIKSSFHPTFNFDSNSVGSYFFPANLGARWTMRTVQQIFDAENKLLRADTLYSFEEVVSDSDLSLQGLPIIICQSSLPYRYGDELTAKTQEVEYYVDDSVVMAISNHSITSDLNKVMLLNPLRPGAHWKDHADDTVVSRIVAVTEPVSTPLGDFTKSVVVTTSTHNSVLSKYFVQGVGIVKVVFRGVPPTAKGTFVVTSELVKLDRGDEKRGVKNRFSASR